ncbi:LacI family DNA-binding transcriptional regulator [Subtercola frigoramans]|uniref:LacI family transcriptional regulator n=1 Tax=Subtercola frigoramans TaxID=120298 RepID=A0ABS2L1N2_9MICO|nr:LacI family DNA-binding transcriptional regulator [Subtercola frigoramans]MBM7470675.1 LacI family transcriptional regulator [Subtercola frigoramans]
MQTAAASMAEPGGGHRTTMNAVAKVSGVSVGTVSKVLNDRAGIGDETRTRVREAIDRLGYVSMGQRQAAQHAGAEVSIELLVQPADVSNPYLATFLGGALESAGLLGAGLVIRSVEIPRDSEREWARSLAKAGRTGVIELTSGYSQARELALRGVGLPMVLVDPIDVPRTSTPSIGATNWAGGYAATRHLLDLGHRRIAYIGGPVGAACDNVRIHGWSAAMAEEGIVVDVRSVLKHSYTYAHGLQAATQLLSQSPRPTAIFAGSDITAMGVIEAARQAGIHVPTQLSVVGFDDTVLAAASSPPLTTVHQPIADIGRQAVSTLFRLAGGESLATKRIEMATSLVIRESTAAVPLKGNK